MRLKQNSLPRLFGDDFIVYLTYKKQREKGRFIKLVSGCNWCKLEKVELAENLEVYNKFVNLVMGEFNDEALARLLSYFSIQNGN